MLPDMRTTIDLDEDAIEAAKQLAKERGRTLGRAALPSTGSFAEKLSLTRLYLGVANSLRRTVSVSLPM
jgi:hypothetical protein